MQQIETDFDSLCVARGITCQQGLTTLRLPLTLAFFGGGDVGGDTGGFFGGGDFGGGGIDYGGGGGFGGGDFGFGDFGGGDYYR